MTPAPREHSPLPWTVYRCQFVDEIGQPNQVACGFNGASLDCSRDECHHPLSLADAEFVVEAVNNYEKLLALNAELVGALEEAHRQIGDKCDGSCSFVDLIRRAKEIQEKP